ncbi:uncharacterized protein LOC100881984 isoform X2 [Megachile rotundata]
MSSSGFRGRGFGLRGARSNGPINGFNGPRFPHPGFNYPRPPHRLPGLEKWIEHPKFMSWQQNKNFHPHPQYRGNLQFRPNSRGRAVSGRGIVRFSGPGRPPAPQFCMGFIRNPASRIPLLQEEQVEDKSITVTHIPLLGSEEERQQKITETVDKLKQKLSSITEEDLTNFWEDDLSILPNNGFEEDIQNKVIPELRHEPPELDLTFTDFKDIGRVDCNNLKLDSTDETFNDDEITITFEEKSKIINTNDEIIIVDENKEESLNTLNFVQNKNVLNQSDVLENDEHHKKLLNDLPDPECNSDNLNLQCNNVTENLMFSNSNDINEKSSNLKENLINSTSIELISDLITERSSNLSNVETKSVSETASNNQGALQVDFPQNQNPVETDINDTNKRNVQDTIIHQIDAAEIQLVKNDHIQNDVQTNISHKEPCQNLVNISDPSQKGLFNNTPSNEDINLNIACDSNSLVCRNFSEVNKSNGDKKLNNTPIFKPRVFNVPPRFAPRIQGPRCRWPFQQNGKNLFPHGPQRLPFHGNRITPPRHVTPFKSNDLVSVVYDPRARPPFTPNVPVSSHNSQHAALPSFSPKDFPPAFDPSEPPPNIRPKVIESSNMQENMQVIPSLDSRNQTVHIPRGINTIQPHPTFDSRGPLLRIPNVTTTNDKLPEFNPQQPPPKVHKRDETLQPPPIFDPRLSSKERSNLIAPLDASRSNMINLIETSSVSDFSIASNFPRPPLVNIPSHQPYISTVQTNFPPILPQTNNGQMMMREFTLLPSSINITSVPLPPPKESPLEQNSNPSQGISMDDGLEDMQEAMEFAKQIMNMTEEAENEKVSLTPSEIPIPNESASHSSVTDEVHSNALKKQKRKEIRKKKCKQGAVCGPELINEKPEDIEANEKEQNRNKNIEETLLTQDQVRPKVVFNLNSKAKKIHKSEEWHRTPISNQENKETCQQDSTQNYDKQKVISKKYPENKRNNTNQDKNKQSEDNIETNSGYQVQNTNISVHEQLNNTHQDHTKGLEKSHLHSSNAIIPNMTMNLQKNQKSRKESKKVEAPTSESMWKNRVISRFLKMSKNDICNMVNNSSLRKFDIAMKHLVKEKRPSLSLEMRNTEDEKMKEYDREEFMNQLNAMLDPGAVVGITDLPTEFIHHLSEVLQLDPMPFDLEFPEAQNSDVNKTPSTDQNDISNMNTLKCLNKETKIQHLTNFPRYENMYMESGEDNSSYNEEELSYLSLSQDNVNSSKSSLTNKLNSEAENTCKKQQPLFNEADLDDILSEVTDKSEQITKQSMIQSNNEMCKSSLLMQTVSKPLECNAFLQIPNKTVADLDDIFSAGIARVKSLGKSTDLDNSRTRKCSSEDRGTFRSERYERWYRKEQEDPDTFRNLTKEEWEAKYGSINATASLAVTRLCASSSAENLSMEDTRNKENRNCRAQRYCSSDSPMRHLSLSPSTFEVSTSNSGVCTNESEEIRRDDQSGSSSSASMSSSSDSDEETVVAPDVTKLLKVIKQKEKIAKKRSVNETIRDEVTAEIEKKWKEKSKYKERKSRKREKRKKDRKEKRKKEKKKRRNRNSHSDTSRSSEQMEEFRLLTENEIKKEVIIKEEPVSTFQENVPLNNEINHSSVVPNLANKPVEVISRTESQNSQLEKQQFSRVTCDITSSQNRNKPTVLSITVQPKTKAQLKQMPEFSNTQEKQIIEKTVAFTKNNLINADSKKMKDQTEKIKHNETVENNNERIDTVPSMNNSFHHINVSVNITEPSLFVQPQIETNSDNNEVNTKLLMCNSSNSVNETNENNQSIDQKIVAAGATLTETKSGYKKIDIKAYKERTLQRRLKEQAMAKENSESSIAYSKNLHHISPISNANTESLNITKEIKAIEGDVNKGLLKDPRLDKTKTASIPEAKQKTDAGEKCQNIISSQKNKESLVPVQLKNVNESRSNEKKKNTTELIESEINTLHNSDKVHKNNLQSFSKHTTVVREFDNGRKKLKTLPSTVESTKFKNIRSEGSKELKLKKEKIKKSMEKKKQSLTIEKQADKKVIEGIQVSSLISSTNQTKTEKIDNCKKCVSLSEPQITHSETFSNTELIINNEPKHKEMNTCSMTEETVHVLSTNNDITNQVNANVQHRTDQESTEIQSSINLKNKKTSIKNIEKSMMKDVYPAEMENLTTLRTQNNVTSSIQDVQASEVVSQKSNTHLEAKVNNLKNQNNNKPMLQLQDEQNSSDYDKDLGAKSPNSPKSPFKGFHVESIKETIHQISELGNKNSRENIKKYPEQCLQSNHNNKSVIDLANSEQTTDIESSKKRKDSNETSPVCNLPENQPSFTESDITSRIIHDDSNVTDKIEIGMKTLETEDSNTLQEQAESSDANTKHNDNSPIMNIHNQDTFGEDSEPFIVLDEYIDDADEKSIEKLSALDLDLEDCIARDADVFTSKHQQEKDSTNSVKPSNFNSLDFKDLSEVFDKNNDREENQNIISEKEKSLSNKRNILSKEFTHEEPIINSTNVVSKLNLEITKNSKLVDSIVPVIPAITKQNIETDIANIPKNNSQHNSERFKVTRSRAASIESETLLKLNVPTKTVIRKSLENLSAVDTPSFETQVEFLKSNKQLNNSEQRNKRDLNDSLVDKLVSTTTSEIKTPTVEEGKLKSVSKATSKKLDQREGNETLHKVKNKSKMKHTKRKKRDVSKQLIAETVNSDITEVKYPNTKETIMARMIEIDVEIHKLMTEKMTLYQMLTNGTTPTENNLHQNNMVHTSKEIEVPIVRPRTPSVLMSQLIQNLETSPVTNPCAKRSTGTASVKDTMVNSTQCGTSKASSKQEHNTEKKESHTFICDSNEEEIINTSSNKLLTSKKKKKHKSEKTIKKLENKSDNNMSTTDLQKTAVESKQSNEQDFSHNSLNEIDTQEDSNRISTQKVNTENTLNNDKAELDIDKVNEKSDESTESTIFTNVTDSKIEKTCSAKDNENIIETSNVKDLSLNSVIKPLDNKILERSLIYSDDSTWDTLLQNSSTHNKKKLNTGLALLEETYRKEIAKTRKTKIESRKKKKKKLQNVPEVVNTLTPEEEELPLSALCAKKLHKKKKLLNSRDQQPEQTDTDQQLWKNVVEVINAVAKNRTDQLYMEGSERQSSGDSGDVVLDIERNAISKSLEEKENQTVFSSILNSTKDNASKNLDKNNLQLILPSDKSQHYEESGEQNLEAEVTSKCTSNLSETTVSIENNIIEPLIQKTVENDGIEINQLHLIEDSDNTNNNRNTFDISQANLHEEKVDKLKELNVQKKDINIKKNLTTDEPSLQMVTMLQNSKKNENLVESNNCKNLTTYEIEKEDYNFTGEKNKQNNSSISDQKHVTDTSKEVNYVSDNEYFMNLKKQKSIQNSKAVSEENNNSSSDMLKAGETSSKRVPKRKRNRKVAVRRSSRYTEETVKHIKLETDGNSQGIEQELPCQKNVQTIFPKISDTPLPEKEMENAQLNAKKFKPQKSVFNKKKYRPGPPVVEIPTDQLIPIDESVKEIKNCKQYIVSETKNCEVRLVDCKHTILNPNVRPNVLQKYGISTINSCPYLNSTQTDSVTNIVQSTSTKDLLNSTCVKRKISITEECVQSQPAKLVRFEETQPSNNEIDVADIENDNEEYTNLQVDVMPILTKEPVVINVPENCDKPEIEIVEEKTTSTINQQCSNSESTLTVIDTNDDKELPRIQYTVHKGPILDIKVFENSFLAASEDGRVYRYNQASNGILNIYKGHTAAVTCLYVYNTMGADISKEWMFSGSLDGTLRCYNITTGAQVRDTADVGSPIQCMDEAWGIIFIGTKSGHVSRYHVKSGVIKGNSIQFSDKSVLALKATNEGPRKVLIVASRSQPITIRDAQNGLFLRTICGQKSHTVYSLMRDNNLIYCGTSSTSIPVFDFTNGEQILQYDAGVGIVCMRLYKQLLFAGCYDGNIYVFDTKDHRLVCSIAGPGNMLLSMEVIDNKIIAGSKDKRLQSWQMPIQVRTLLQVNQL